MKTSLKGYNAQTATFFAEDVNSNYPVKPFSSGYVTNCIDGNDFIGIAQTVRGDVVGVQLDGYVEVPYSGTAPTIGNVGLVADGNGGVKQVASAVKKYKVLCIDASTSTVGFIL